MSSNCDDCVTDVETIVNRLTEDQKTCILNLTEDWQSSGYNRIQADLLWSTDLKFYPGRFGPLVDCRYHAVPGRSPNYEHRLLPLGLEVKMHLENQLELA